MALTRAYLIVDGSDLLTHNDHQWYAVGDLQTETVTLCLDYRPFNCWPT